MRTETFSCYRCAQSHPLNEHIPADDDELCERCSNEEPVALIYNNEGKLLGLPLNRALRNGAGVVYDIISATFFLCNTLWMQKTSLP